VSACDFLLNNTTATVVSVGLGDSGTLAGASLTDIKQKNYTHTVLVTDNTIKLKTAFTFNTSQEGFNGAAGPVCWTNGQAANQTTQASDNSITCGATSAAVVTDYPYHYFGTAGNYVHDSKYSLTQGLAPAGALANTDTNGDYLFLQQPMTAALDLTTTEPADIALKLSFMVTQAAKLVFYHHSTAGSFCANASTPCVGNIEVVQVDIRVAKQ
jgi:hypothetical protein